MEATKEDRPTNLKGANLSVLPKGSKYHDGSGVKVSNAARPTNLTDAKASGADFTEADLCGATFTATTLKDATLKDATFTPFRPPERPASGALSGAWRAKSLLGSVGRAMVAAADDDDDDDDSDQDNEEEEEKSPIDAEMETAIDAVMDRLAAAAQNVMHTVDDLVAKSKRCSGTRCSRAARGRGVPLRRVRWTPSPTRILAELLRTKLESATDKAGGHLSDPLHARLLSTL